MNGPGDEWGCNRSTPILHPSAFILKRKKPWSRGGCRACRNSVNYRSRPLTLKNLNNSDDLEPAGWGLVNEYRANGDSGHGAQAHNLPSTLRRR